MSYTNWKFLKIFQVFLKEILIIFYKTTIEISNVTIQKHTITHDQSIFLFNFVIFQCSIIPKKIQLELVGQFVKKCPNVKHCPIKTTPRLSILLQNHCQKFPPNLFFNLKKIKKIGEKNLEFFSLKTKQKMKTPTLPVHPLTMMSM